MNLANEKRSDKVRALLVGPTGRGKTLAAASWPGKTLIFDFDNRYAPIIDWYPNRLADYNVELISASNFWEVFHAKINSLVEFCQYDNIILDSLTSATTAVVVMQMIAKGAVGKQIIPAKGAVKEKTGFKITGGGVAVPSWDEFNGEQMIFCTLLETLKSLDVNLFVSAHPINRVKIGSGDSGEKYTSLTTFGPKVESVIPTYFDECWFFDYEFVNGPDNKPSLRRFVHTQPTQIYREAKTAIKGLPYKIDITNPDGKPELNLYEQVKKYL